MLDSEPGVCIANITGETFLKVQEKTKKPFKFYGAPSGVAL